MLLNHNSVQINKLYLTGARVSKQQCLAQLKKQPWSFRHSERWYFIRSIHIKSNFHEMPAQLNRTTQNLLQHAVHAAATSSNSYNCIYFNSLLELLIYLSIDLYQQQTEKKWYWQQWNYKTASTQYSPLVSNWLEYIAYLPAIINGLYQRRQLVALWSTLDEQDFKALYYAFSEHLGLDYQHFNHFVFNRHTTELPGLFSDPVQKLTQKHSVPELNRIVKPSNKTTSETYPDSPWREIFQLYSVPQRSISTQTPAALKLASLLILNHKKPQILSTDLTHTSQEIYTIFKTFANTSTAKNSSDPIKSLNTHSLNKNPILYNKVIVKDQSATTGSQNKSALTSTDHTNINNSVINIHSSSNKQIQIQDEYLLVTEYAGLFYLINILNHPDIKKLFYHHALLKQDFAAYKLLFQLGLFILADSFSTVKSEQSCDQRIYDQAMLGLFKKITHSESHQLLFHPDLKELCQNIINQLKQSHLLEALLQPDLLLKKASVSLTRSHLDIYYTIADIDIDIRLAGLDINPGWVNWLGRVVTFHYQEDAKPLP